MSMTKPVTHGTKFVEIMENMTDKEREEILRVMARAAEKSYRRGFQQGATLGGDEMEIHYWRYGRGLDNSPGRTYGNVEKSLDRLLMENRDLWLIR